MPNFWQILVSCIVVWMSTNEGDVIRRDEFLHFYRLRKFKDLGYYEFKPWDRAFRLILDYPSSLRNWKLNFFFITGNGWEFVPGKDFDEAPKFFCSWVVPVFGASCSSFFFFFLEVKVIGNLLIFLFCSCPASSSKEEVSTMCGKSKGILGDRQGF